MDFIKSELKNIIIFVAILAGLYFAYTFFFSDNSTPVATISPEGSGGDVGANILPLLLQLKTIKLDQTVFADPIFKSLQNFSVDLPIEGTGRPDPFAPVDQSAVPQGSINVRTTPNN